MTDEQATTETGEDAPNAPRPRAPWLRRRGARIVLAAAIVAVLVGVPAVLTARPGYFERYPGLSEEYGPWSKSTHVEGGCEGCHVPPRVVSRVLYRTRMVGEFYLGLVAPSRVPDVFGSPTNEACLTCHSDLRSVSPKGDVQIPHRAHVTILKMRCVECHDYLVHELSPEGKHTPPMGGCLSCHDGDVADDACTDCHTQKAAPDSHRSADWVIVHAQRADDPECERCHNWSKNWCAECHSHRPRSHASNWREVHGEQVKQHRSCEACHDAAFCTRCHGEVPQVNLNPALKLVE